MGLGNNRDYKSHGDRVSKNLRLHAILTKRYTVVGWNEELASERALEDLKELTPRERKAILKEARS
jgi:hypothetical protein